MNREEIYNSIPNRHKTTHSYNLGFCDGAEWMQKKFISQLSQIIACVEQGITQSATDEAIIKELTNLIKQEDNYSNK